MEELIKAIKQGIKSPGQRALIAHLEGKRLTFKLAVQAKCYECMGYYIDGRRDCECPFCPLYRFRPFQGRIKG